MVPFVLPRAICGVVAVLCLLTGCSPGQPITGPSPLPSSATSTPQVDLTAPGAAEKILSQLLRASGSSQVIMIEVRRQEASVSVLKGSRPETWAFRDGAIKKVQSDLAYVEQAVFDPGDYDLSDVGALFRAGAAVSGSSEQQELQIVDRQTVDHTSSEILMAVSTMPETRTVFFYPNGALLPTLDFRSEWGLTRGLADAIGTHTRANQVGLGSDVGAYIDFAGPNATTARRQRTAKFPVTVNQRNEQPGSPAFDPRLVKPRVVWRVLNSLRQRGQLAQSDAWTVVVDDRDKTGTPRMHFTAGAHRFKTDLDGNTVS